MVTLFFLIVALLIFAILAIGLGIVLGMHLRKVLMILVGGIALLALLIKALSFLR